MCPLARRAEEGMESDDLLCSRNARPQEGGNGKLAVLLLAERTREDCTRSTRAIEDQPGYPLKMKWGIEIPRAAGGLAATLN